MDQRGNTYFMELWQGLHSVGKVPVQHLAYSWHLINASLSCLYSPGAKLQAWALECECGELTGKMWGQSGNMKRGSTCSCGVAFGKQHHFSGSPSLSPGLASKIWVDTSASSCILHSNVRKL